MSGPATTAGMAGRPRPRPSEVSESFWAATLDNQFQFQHCQSCDESIFYPRVNCSACGSVDLETTNASGRGTVYTYTVARRATHRGFSEVVPYVIAIVELEEGPHVTTNIVDCDPDTVSIGMDVEVVFEPAIDGSAIPLFRPAL